MIKLLSLIKINRYLKIKRILPLLWNYSIFSLCLDSVISSPNYLFLRLNMQQKKVNYIKKFIFFKLKRLKYKLIFKKLYLYKYNSNKNDFLNHLFFFVMLQILIFISNLLFLQIFSYIPFKFRAKNLKYFLIDTFISKKKAVFFSFNFICFELRYCLSNLFKNSVKFIKKFLNDNNFLKYFFQIAIFLFQTKLKNVKQFLGLFLDLENFLTKIYYSQVDCVIAFTIKKQILDSSINLKARYRTLIFFLEKAIFNGYKEHFYKKKKCFKKVKNKRSSLLVNYLRVNKKILFISWGSAFKLYSFKKNLYQYFNSVFVSLQTSFNTSFSFLGFDYKINFVLQTVKSSYLKFTNNIRFKKFFFIKRVLITNVKSFFINLDMLTIKNQPKYCTYLLFFYSTNILNWYLYFFFGLLKYYKNCSNLRNFFLSFYYICKWSLLYTLAKKHKKTVNFLITKYTKYINTTFSFMLKKVYLATSPLKQSNLLFLNYTYNYYL